MWRWAQIFNEVSSFSWTVFIIVPWSLSGDKNEGSKSLYEEEENNLYSFRVSILESSIRTSLLLHIQTMFYYEIMDI